MKKKLLILLSIFMFIPCIIFADSVSISCSKTKLVPGESVECTIKGNTSLTADSDNYVAGVTGRVSVLGDMEIVSVTKDSSWDNGSNEEKIDFYTNKGFNGNFNIAKVKVKVKSNYTSGALRLLFKFNDSGNVEFYDKFGTTRSAGTTSIEFKVSSSVDTLSNLSVDGYELNPSFDPNVFNYDLGSTDAASIKISATASDSGATISGAGNKSLAYGTNTFKVVCKSEKGTTKTYKITINRNDTRDTNNNLRDLTIDGYEFTPSFSSGTTSYTLDVEGDVNSINIIANTDSIKSSFVKGYGPREVKLNYGKNEILIKVKSENEKTKTYTIIVNKKDDRENNNYLKSLTIEGYEVDFNKNTNKYEINVMYDVNSLKITAEAESLKANVTISGNSKFKEGVNTVTISVKAENETTRKYVINVIKGNNVEEIEEENEENSASIFNVTIDGKDFGFDELINDYNIKLDQDKNELDLKYELGEGITGEISGNEKLINGSVVTLTVNGIGEKIIYTFNIIKDAVAKEVVKEEKSNMMLYVIIGGVILIGLIIFIILKKKKNKKEEVEQTVVEPTPVVEPVPVVETPTPVVEPTSVVEPTPVVPSVQERNIDDLNPVDVVISSEEKIVNPMIEPNNATPVVNNNDNVSSNDFQRLNF